MQRMLSGAILLVYLLISLLGHGGLHTVPGFAHHHSAHRHLAFSRTTAPEPPPAQCEHHSTHRHGQNHAHHHTHAGAHRHSGERHNSHDDGHSGGHHDPAHDDTCLVCQWFAQSQTVLDSSTCLTNAPLSVPHRNLVESQRPQLCLATYSTRGPPAV